MKRIINYVIVCGIAFSSCSNKEFAGAKITSELYAMGSKSASVSSFDELDLLFTVNDIKFFKTDEAYDFGNGSAFHGEIVFTNLKTKNLLMNLGYRSLYLFLGDSLLFDPPIEIYYMHPVSSNPGNDLHIKIIDDNDGTFYLSEHYQSWDWLPDAKREPLLKVQEENHEMRKRQVEAFKKYLSDAGKLIF